jgi:putative DNA primase/helicase
MTAAEIAAALGKARREGRGWRTECPVHHGHSLNLADGRDGKLLVTCWAGCSAAAIFEELRRLDLDSGPPAAIAREIVDRREDDPQRSLWAQRLWDRARDARKSPVTCYLRSRGLTIAPPASLRWLRHCKHPSGVFLPAMIAKVVNVDGELVAVHRTYLLPDGSGKAAVDKQHQKMSLGPVAGSSVRLAAAAGTTLAVTEGIETGLSVQQATGTPAWAALSAPGIKALVLPSSVETVVIYADHDANRVGEHAARAAGQRWLGEGKQVRLLMPRRSGRDFNDLLVEGGSG